MLSAADCLNARAELAVEIARVRERDANGHVAHALVATLAIFLQPIANAPANIGFGLLVAMCALRVHRLWRVWALMFRDWFWLLLVAWAAWTGITLFWSEDVAYGFRQWTAFRAILWVPMLWPVIDRWRWLVGALLAGVASANVLQVLQFTTGWPPPRQGRPRGTGLHMYTYTGAWAAVGFSIWLMRAVMESWRGVAIGVAMATLAAAGVVLAGTRGVVTAVVVEVLALSACLVLARPRWMAMAVSRTMVGLVILACLWFTLGSVVQRRIADLAENSRAFIQGRAVATPAAGSGVDSANLAESLGPVPGLVLVMDPYRGSVWMYAVREWATSPLTGVGAGTLIRRTKAAAAAGVAVRGLNPEHLQIGHAHSTWLQCLAEGGVVGFLLPAGWAIGVIAIACGDVRSGGHGREMCMLGRAPGWMPPALLGAFLAFLVASQFDCYHMNATAFAMGVIPAAMLVGLRLSPAWAAWLRAPGARASTACPG